MSAPVHVGPPPAPLHLVVADREEGRRLATPEGVVAADPSTDQDLPEAHEIPKIAGAMGISDSDVAWLVAAANKRQAAYMRQLRGDEPDPLHYADGELQAERAFWALYSSKTAFPRLPWAAADAIAGPLCPGDLVILGARTGGGKTTLVLNLVDRWVETGRTVCVLGLEQTPHQLRTKWACLRAGVAPEIALAHDATRLGSRTMAQALAAVAEQLAWQRTWEIRQRARFAPTKFVTQERLVRVAEWAAEVGCEALIVDHVDRLDHGDGFNAFHEMSQTIRLAKELAVRLNLVMILASQAKRVSDKAESFLPMSLEDLRGGGTKEEESDLVLTPYRPLRSGVTPKMLTAVRQGLMQPAAILESGIMGIKNLKSRLIDVNLGRTCKLRVHHGRLTDITPPEGPPHVHSQHPTRVAP